MKRDSGFSFKNEELEKIDIMEAKNKKCYVSK